MLSHIASLYRLQDRCLRFLNHLSPLLSVAARLYVAQVFWASALTKLRNWDSTMFLFEEEYHVPWLSPELAAYLGTGGEFILPLLLAPGLMGRFAALGLSVVNGVAVLSLQEIAPAALMQHIYWGSILLWLTVSGPGKWSLDERWLNKAPH